LRQVPVVEVNQPLGVAHEFLKALSHLGKQRLLALVVEPVDGVDDPPMTIKSTVVVVTTYWTAVQPAPTSTT